MNLMHTAYVTSNTSKHFTEEALANDVKVAVCSTSNERAVSTIVRVMLGDAIAARMPVFAGDVVPKKKPAPDIYLLAAEKLGVNPARCVVVEDSRIGLLAAKAAGMRCVVTTSSYTGNEDFALADAVFDCIGEDGEARFGIQDLTTPGSWCVGCTLGRLLVTVCFLRLVTPSPLHQAHSGSIRHCPWLRTAACTAPRLLRSNPRWRLTSTHPCGVDC